MVDAWKTLDAAGVDDAIRKNPGVLKTLSENDKLINTVKNYTKEGQEALAKNADEWVKNIESRKLLKEGKVDEVVQKYGGEMVDAHTHGGVKFVESGDSNVLDDAIAIANKTDDVPKITDNLASELGLSGVAKDKLAQQISEMKDHFWKKEHLVEIDKGKFSVGRFARDSEDIVLWKAAEDGFQNAEQIDNFKKLLAHEYVESKLMKEGFSYRGMDNANWDEYLGNVPTSFSYGAHDLAPKFNEIGGGRFGHWQTRMDKSIDGLIIKDDLSNLDELVNIIKNIEGLN